MSVLTRTVLPFLLPGSVLTGCASHRRVELHINR